MGYSNRGLVVIFLFIISRVNCNLILPEDSNIKLVNVEKLDDDGKIILAWEVDLTKETIVFEIEAATLGYVGFGISPQGSMEGADILIAGVLEDGTPYFSVRAYEKF